MVRSTPPSDWVAYVVVGLTVGGMLLGKYLIGRGDTPIGEVINEEIEEVKHLASEIEHKIEEEIELIEEKIEKLK
ncbi:MAG: hypothetical protein PHF17_02605 [Arcobacteraceae bacterium]|jgi:hypothetical protein|nr:hypothetical protein [Arcobacteraceae bacterium]